MTKRNEVTIDATGKKLGRLSTHIADLLNGKFENDYAPNKLTNSTILVKNASKLSLPVKKTKTKLYKRYTGYFGGLKIRTLEEVIKRKGYDEVIRKSVYGMLPVNRLRKLKLKQLIIEE